MADTIVVPSTPDPQTVTLIAGQVRNILAGLSGMGLIGGVWASMSDNQISLIVTAGLSVVSVVGWVVSGVWSWWQKNKAAHDDHANSVASAQAGTAVTVVSPAPAS